MQAWHYGPAPPSMSSIVLHVLPHVEMQCKEWRVKKEVWRITFKMVQYMVQYGDITQLRRAMLQAYTTQQKQRPPLQLALCVHVGFLLFAQKTTEVDKTVEWVGTSEEEIFCRMFLHTDSFRILPHQRCTVDPRQRRKRFKVSGVACERVQCPHPNKWGASSKVP